MFDFSDLKNKIKKKLSLKAIFVLTSFVLLLCFSWLFLFQPSVNDREEQLHSLLQNQFQTLISDLAVKQRPATDEIIFHKVWTKKSDDPHKIKIFFSYSLKTKGEAGGNLLIKGSADMEKSIEKPGLWLAQNFKITESALDFSKPLLIKAPALQKDQQK